MNNHDDKQHITMLNFSSGLYLCPLPPEEVSQNYRLVFLSGHIHDLRVPHDYRRVYIRDRDRRSHRYRDNLVRIHNHGLRNLGYDRQQPQDLASLQKPALLRSKQQPTASRKEMQLVNLPSNLSSSTYFKSNHFRVNGEALKRFE